MSKSYDNEKQEATSYAATQGLSAVGMNQYDTAAVEFIKYLVRPYRLRQPLDITL